MSTLIVGMSLTLLSLRHGRGPKPGGQATAAAAASPSEAGVVPLAAKVVTGGVVRGKIYKGARSGLQ